MSLFIYTVKRYNFDVHEPILLIFGRHLTEKVSNQKLLCFPSHLTSDSALLCETWSTEIVTFTLHICANLK